MFKMKTILSATGYHVGRKVGLTVAKATAATLQTTLDVLKRVDGELKGNDKSRGEPPKQEDSPVD